MKIFIQFIHKGYSIAQKDLINYTVTFGYSDAVFLVHVSHLSRNIQTY